ncbi:MAG: TIGR00269 family protein [archaeon]
MKLGNSQFKFNFEKKVKQTIRKYNLCNRKDKVGVAVSGGKDSMVTLYLLKKFGYDIEAITIDAKIGAYTDQNLKNLKKLCKELDVKLHVISFRDEFGSSLCHIQSVLKSNGYNYSSCMICGILKRYLLNKYSKKLKFDCLATGHNLDDEAQAFMMNVFRSDVNQAKKQGPISGIIKSDKFVKRIKPLYFSPELDVERFSKIMKFPVNYEICPCSVGAYRREYKNILDEFEKKHPSVKFNIVRFHEKLILPLRENAKQVKIDSCEICDEPSSRNVCKTCELLICLKKSPKKNLNKC